MGRHHIKSSDLAKHTGRSKNSISRLRQSLTFPRLSAKELNDLIKGLEELANPKTKTRRIDISDLMEVVDDIPEPDDDDRELISA